MGKAGKSRADAQDHGRSFALSEQNAVRSASRAQVRLTPVIPDGPCGHWRSDDVSPQPYRDQGLYFNPCCAFTQARICQLSEFEGMADCGFQASGGTLSFQVLGRRMGLRFVCSRIAISFIVVTAGTRKKSSSFPFEFATKAPDVAHIVCIALRCARAMRRNVVNLGRGLRAWKCA